MHQRDWDASHQGHAAGQLGAPIVVDDSPNMTMPEIRSKARRIKKQHGLEFIVIDYLQLMTSGKRVENRQVEVSEFSRNIKLLAKELECPGRRDQPAEPWLRAAHRQDAADLRPA